MYSLRNPSVSESQVRQEGSEISDLNALPSSTRVMRVGIEFAACMLVAAGAGMAADWMSKMTPVFCIAGLMLGTVAGFRVVYRVSREMEAEERARKQ